MRSHHTDKGGAARVSMPDTESLWRTIFGLTPLEAEVVVALVAAGVSGLQGRTVKQLRKLTSCNTSLISLERKLWIVRVAQVEGSTSYVWAATALAYKRLELVNWEPMLFSDEELPRVDATLPGFLKPLPAEEDRAAS